MTEREKPWLVYDGDCGFCRRWVHRWKAATGARVRYVSSEEAAPELPQIPAKRFKESVQLVEPDGSVFSGAEAVFRALSYAPRGGWALRAYRRLPAFAQASEMFYRSVAGRRILFSRITTLLWGKRLEPPRHRIARWLFLRGLGLTYLAAFLSFWVQWRGLIGAEGMLPFASYLEAVKAQLGTRAYALAPTLCWLDSSDAFLEKLCLGGAAAAILLTLGLLPALSTAACWLLYLSLVTVGQVFLGYQWDNLLLEAGLLAVFFAPWVLLSRPSREREPSKAFLWLLRWLLFRLMFSSGIVKILSGDPVWRDFSALRYHYETQPLPTWVGWWAHQLPAGVQAFSTAAMFAIELVLPFLIFLPRRPRLAAAGGFLVLMVLIAATGNYCFFNVLAALLCLTITDDAFLHGRLPGRLTRAFEDREPVLEGAPKRLLNGAAAAVLFALSVPAFCGTVRWPFPGFLTRLSEAAYPFRSVNPYGLFAVMTTTRPEIIVEGSDDGEHWLPYEFKWKAGDPSRRPRFVEPHQPRLDWQMWFAALGDFRQNPWFMNFQVRLLQGKPEVLSLLAKNPFPAKPPRYVRGTYYDYRFTDRAARKSTGAWWRRELKGLYSPPIFLR